MTPMGTARRRLSIGVALGTFMSAIVWLNLSEASPLYAELLQQPRIGHSLLVLNLPALFLSRLLFGTPPAIGVVVAACFLQWFALGIALSFGIWRGARPVPPVG